MCCVGLEEKIRMSSMQTMTKSRSSNMVSMRRWNVAPEFLRPKHEYLKTNDPKGVMTAVFLTSSSLTGT